MNDIIFEKIANGIWRGHVGGEGDSVLGLVENDSALGAVDATFQDTEFPFDGVYTEKIHGKTVVCVPYDRKERLYGPGLSFGKLARNYDVIHLHVDHFSGRDDGRTHVPTPFYVSDRGCGVFIDTPEYTSFYMGGSVRADAKNPPKEQNRGRGEWSATTPGELVEASFEGGADVYVFAGDSMLSVVARFNLLCGGGALVPKWGFGFWQRTHINFCENDVKDEINLFREHDFDLDVIGLEPGWHSNSYPCTYQWDSERFPDPTRFVGNLLKENIRVNLWENLFVSEKSELHDEIAPYCGSHKVWNGIVPDFTLENARELYAEQHERRHISIGVSGYKIDECDGFDGWLFPDHASFPSGRSAAVVRTTLGILAQKTIYNAYKKQNKRTYGLVRASAAGSSMMPFCIYNDCYSFNEFMTGLASASFCGCLWVPEVRDAKNADEWVRRFQMCVFSPMLMLNAWANGAKPWQFPEVEDIIRDTIRFRKALLPYIYNAFYTYHKKGIPPFRALCLDFSATGSASVTKLDHTENPYETLKLSEIIDQYMAGDCLMVCPVRPGETKRKIVLPPCDWYDYYTGEYVGNAETVEIECPLDKIPLYVKAGGMIPMIENGQLIVRCFGERGEGFIYDDDGVSFDCESGDFTLITMRFMRKNGEITGVYERVYEGGGFKTEYKTVKFQ